MSYGYKIFGSGDKASSELVDVFTTLGLPYEFCDIRTETRGERQNLIFLIHRGKKTVPQVFAPNGDYIGDFEQTIEAIR